MLGKLYQGQDCSLARALEIVGGRWTLLIVRDAFYGVRRFNDFQAHLDIPRGVLADRLGELVENGVIQRQRDPDHAGRHLYTLTTSGRDLWPAVNALLSWGSRHVQANSLLFRHVDCGTEIETDGECGACGVRVPPEDLFSEPAGVGGSRRTDPVATALRERHRLLVPVETHESLEGDRERVLGR